MISRSCLCSVLCLAIVLFALDALGTTITVTLDFPRPEITYEKNRCIVGVEGLPIFADPGEPLLPVYTYRVLLPQGERIAKISAVAPLEHEIAVDYPLLWEQNPLPLGYSGPIKPVSPSETVYGCRTPFPAARAGHVTTQTYRGYDIAYIRVFPVTYAGAMGIVVYAPRLEIEIETIMEGGPWSNPSGTLRLGNRNDLAKVQECVDDVTYAGSYTHSGWPVLGSELVDPQESYPNVIITHSSLESIFQGVKDLRDNQGLYTRIVLVSEISSGYTGADLQEKIRNFITDAYINWETEYVLLAGDDEFIPHRGLYAEILPYIIDPDVASDLYYGALDGNWNNDGDSNWGEPGEADLVPDVSVGRIPVGTTAEAANFVNKLVRYETAPVVSQIRTAQMTGELLYDEPTWGADSKEEIIGGSSANGFTTTGIPVSWTITTLFDRDLYPAEWDKFDVTGNLNNGIHITNHLGHSINNYTMKMYSGDVLALITNNGIANTYFIAFIQGCYSASFDNRYIDGSYVDDAIGEYFIFIENGAVAYLGTTRYGASAHESTRGAGHYYDRQFFDAVFGENITAIGDAKDDAKIDNIPYIDFRGMRWTHYTLVLLGDPAMDIWTDTPGGLVLELPEVVYTSENEVRVRVTDGSNPVDDARVSIFSDSTCNATARTGGDGIVFLNPDVSQPGTLFVAAKAHNYYAVLDTLQVVSAAQALLMIESATLDDDGTGQSQGNSDGMADAGEVLEAVISLENIGSNAALDVQATLRSDDPHVTVLDSTGIYGDIAPGATVTPSWSYVVSVSPSVPDGHCAAFEVMLSYSDTSVVRHWNCALHAPVLGISDIAYDDSLYGNGDGCLAQGESVGITLGLLNTGSSEAEGVSLTLGESDPYVELNSAISSTPDIPAGERRQTATPFVITVLPGCPEYHRIELHLNIDLSSGRQSACSSAVFVGGFLDDGFESGAGGWSHGEIVKGFVDEWHLETYRNHTLGGAFSWKCGGDGAGKYMHYSHGALITPELCLGPDATLTFWHWIQVELETGNYVSDGGIVEISTDGGATWTRITPVGGYSHAIYPGTSTPIPAWTPCFGWTNDWTEVQFDLSAYEGAARIRFNFGGGEHFSNEEGWYVDDVVVSNGITSADITEDLMPAPLAFELYAVFPNPVSRNGTLKFDVPRRSRVTIRIYDVTGRVIDTVKDVPYDPGRYSYIWDCRGIAPGIYFVRMQAPGFDRTRKIVIVR
ncbi:MAG: T9SS type A sorting domain-containing protein [bacterium]|nr:MAG: T9SS type A sorting domain-containing protein [bacterium]